MNQNSEPQRKFNENVVYYDKYRPTYTKELFNEIINYSKVNMEDNILEVGIGTGQATLPFLKLGCNVTGIDIGDNIINYDKNKFAEYKNIKLNCCKFEDYSCDENSLQLLYSATAFHWIPAEIGYNKAYKILKPNRCIAVFWNTTREGNDNIDLMNEIEKAYKEAEYEYIKNPIESDWYRKRNDYINSAILSAGFDNLIFRTYTGYRRFTADEYMGLLHTYSDHMSLPDDVRERLFDRIHTVIEHYGYIDIKDTYDLHMGTK